MLTKNAFLATCLAMLPLSIPALAASDEGAGPVAAPTGALFGNSIQPMSIQDLQVERGQAGLDRTLLQLSSSEANARLEDNAIGSAVTGNNSVDRSAFSGASGIVFSVQNTGNHVIIQNSTLINVTLNP